MMLSTNLGEELTQNIPPPFWSAGRPFVMWTPERTVLESSPEWMKKPRLLPWQSMTVLSAPESEAIVIAFPWVSRS